MSIRRDYYLVKSGPARSLFDVILEEHKQAVLEAVKLADELGGIGAGELSHPFHMFRDGMSAVVFQGKRAPAGWRKHKRFLHKENAIGCVPKRNARQGKEIAERMDAVGRDIRRTDPADFYRLFVPEGDPAVVTAGRICFPTAGYIGDRRIATIPRDAGKPPRPAPEGCERVEEWEVMKWVNEKNETTA